MISSADNFAAKLGEEENQSWRQWIRNQLPTSRQIGYNATSALSPLLGMGAGALALKAVQKAAGDTSPYVSIPAAIVAQLVVNQLLQDKLDKYYIADSKERDSAFLPRLLGPMAAMTLISTLINYDNRHNLTDASVIGFLPDLIKNTLLQKALHPTPEEILEDSEKDTNPAQYLENRYDTNLQTLVDEIEKRKKIRNAWDQQSGFSSLFMRPTNYSVGE